MLEQIRTDLGYAMQQLQGAKCPDIQTHDCVTRALDALERIAERIKEPADGSELHVIKRDSDGDTVGYRVQDN
jgi:hypothetical protein